ncbi:MAG TPA: class I SAM-dependent methyltransferase [Patescibacteria group bacterium]|jgi:SAM-dependent methyltransferase|nr:class I SAM-dependent methyltransferase [Patescibacteria group bacterium]
MSDTSQRELSQVYANRFDPRKAYRQRVWSVLVGRFFQKLVPENAVVLDLGCGYGEFINIVRAGKKFGMDLNPATEKHLAPDVTFLRQDCSAPWSVDEEELDIVFTSNFFEHLPDKDSLSRTLQQIFRALKPNGRLIAMGPNIKFTGGRYWDFWDHYLPLTETSLCEGLSVNGLGIEKCFPRFLPYTMVGAREYPPWCVAAYLRLPWLWRWKGEQFLIVARKPSSHV